MPLPCPLAEYHARRVALIKPSALGDIVHCLPVVSAVRRRYPAAHIAWVVNRSYEPLLRGHPDLDETIGFDRHATRHGLLSAGFAWLDFLRGLRRRKFDLVLDMQGLLRSGVMCAVSGAPRRVGLSTAREGARRFYTDVLHVKDFNAVHAIERYWLTAEAFGVGDMPKRFTLAVGDADRAWAGQRLLGFPKPWVAIGPGSRWETKRWLPEHFLTLARWTRERFGGTTVLVGGREEQPLARAVAAPLGGPVLDLTGQTTLPQLTAVLSVVDVMIANDTGPLHLANALGRPVVAPYTCTKVRMTGPFGQESGAVESTVHCQGSYLKKCPRMECMADLTPDRVWPVLREVLHRWETNRRLTA